jgi:hypothetical protein
MGSRRPPEPRQSWFVSLTARPLLRFRLRASQKDRSVRYLQDFGARPLSHTTDTYLVWRAA